MRSCLATQCPPRDRRHYGAASSTVQDNSGRAEAACPGLQSPHPGRQRRAPVPHLNANYFNLRASYLFAEIKQRMKAFTDTHPAARLINLGIGDVTQPLPPAVIRALHEATDEMARRETFRGYGPYAGYDFLLAAIAQHDFASRGI